MSQSGKHNLQKRVDISLVAAKSSQCNDYLAGMIRGYIISTGDLVHKYQVNNDGLTGVKIR